MKEINRIVVVVKPRQPFIDWVEKVCPSEGPCDPETYRRDCTAFLVHSDLEGDEVFGYLEDHFEEILESEMAGWVKNPDLWPQKRDLNLFHEWLEFEVHTVVVDLVPGKIIREEYEF